MAEKKARKKGKKIKWSCDGTTQDKRGRGINAGKEEKLECPGHNGVIGIKLKHNRFGREG